MAATSTSSDPTAATTEGPVLSLINKRLRAFRKKLNRILQMEESLSEGKTLNNEQLEVVNSKPTILSLIDELDKLRSPLTSAVDEELSIAASKPTKKNDGDEEVVKDVLNLMYFGSLFDVKQQSEFTSLMLTRTHERGCCLTYDYVTDDANDDILAERDLDSISALQALMISRPVNSPVSHQKALDKCIHHAKLWLSGSDELIDSHSNVTYGALREKLKKIIASDYFTATPQMKGPGEVAAGVANFGSFQVPVQVEPSAQHYTHTEENSVNFEEYEVEHQSGNVEELQKDDVEPDNPPEVFSAQTEQEQLQAEEEQGFFNSDFKEQQYVSRIGSRGGRGGGGGRRRSYFNGRGGRGSGRGGGPFQNGRSYQYHDNYHQPRNYHSKRGGRGGGSSSGSGSGSGSYYSHPSATQGNHTQANVGIPS